MTQPTLSVILVTKNESARISACLASVAFADEWIVVDAGSSDDTVALARARAATVVVTDDWPGFGVQKQRALDLAGGDWVLALDADEQVTPELAASIRAAMASATGATARPAGYEIERLSSFCGHWIRHGDWYPDRVLRLFRRQAARFTPDTVHERVSVSGPIGRLEGHLLHDTMPTLEDALGKMNRYSSGRAEDLAAAGRQGGLARGLAHSAWAFVRSYVLKRGFMDGAAGFILAKYIADTTYYRYLKMAERARRLPTPR